MAKYGEMRYFWNRIHDLPLRYRLSIPFFFLACFGTLLLDLLAIMSQEQLIQQSERHWLKGYDRAFDRNMELQGRWAVSLASSFALNPEVGRALANRDRLQLIELCYPSYVFMKKEYGISQFNFHVLPPRNFLRLQRLYEFGDDLSYRLTILDAVAQKREIFGLESGLTGYGIRGVAPIYYQGNMVGTVEIGFNFGFVFLEDMKKQFDIEASLLQPVGASPNTFRSFATTFPQPSERTDTTYAQVFKTGQPDILIKEIDKIPYAILIRTVKDYKNQTVGLVEFCMSRTDTLGLIGYYQKLLLSIGILGMLLSVGAIYILSDLFTRPIGRMVTFAREIASGAEVTPPEMRPSGELGVLWEALVDMLFSLEESQAKIKDYAENLEDMVHSRTRALRESEEKYRTLVESVPFMVYRLLGDGRIIFVNHFIEELTGIPSNRAMDGDFTWKDRVLEEDRERIWPLMDRCLKEGKEFKAEYRIRHTDSKTPFVLDHALPVLDEYGKVDTVDGFMIDVTDRHHLQQQIIQTEELRTLTEISARLAHEIRNPLVAAGGFARRLLVSLPEEDPNRGKVQIIVHEVGRLEKILERTLAYLKPFEVNLERGSLNEIVIDVLDGQAQTLQNRSLELKTCLAAGLPLISMDPELFRNALDTILTALLAYCESGYPIEIKSFSGESIVQLEMIATGAHLSEDDMEHFFYPFMSRAEAPKSLDLPLAKMIIYKHHGLISLRRKDPRQLVLSISLPV